VADSDSGVVLNRTNLMDYKDWLGALVAKALLEKGAITFFVDQDGDVQMEIPQQKTIGTGREIQGGDL
jgi:hypothetical protein